MESNKELFSQAKRLIPGGVNSPVRAFNSVGGNPIFIRKAKGAKIYDGNNKEYIDYCMSWGVLILGHANREIAQAIEKQSLDGTSFGAPTQKEVMLAKLIKDAISSIEKIRFVNSGTEATMTAIRLARAFTERDYIIKFDGCYHGHCDSLLVNAGSGLSTFALSSSKGIPNDFIKYTISLPYNNTHEVKRVCQKNHGKIACIIVEPIAANMGLVLPQAGFLETLREVSEKYKIVLIFDEIITGFRLHFAGAQDIFRIKPDLTTLGKIIGAGLPIGAVGGKRQIMDLLSPEGDVYQAGTLSGNPIATSAGLTALEILRHNKQIYNELENKTKYLVNRMKFHIQRKKIDMQINSISSIFTLFFAKDKVIDYQSSKKSDIKRFRKYFRRMLREGVYLPPSQFEACFISKAHTKSDLDITIDKFKSSISKL